MSATTQQNWRENAEEFQRRWQFPNCVGAIDWKHVLIKAPPKSGSLFFNYKGTFSVVLLAVVDANYCFSVIDVGGYGKQSDGGTFATSVFGAQLKAGTLPIPPVKAPDGYNVELPHVFVADAAFPLMTNLLRPYPGRLLSPSKQQFNYRLSRARRVAENAFGILASRFRVYRRFMEQRPDTVDKVIKATCVLHNMLRKEGDSVPRSGADSEDYDDDAVADDLTRLRPLRRVGCRASHDAFAVRDSFCEYFTSPAGQLPW